MNQVNEVLLVNPVQLVLLANPENVDNLVPAVSLVKTEKQVLKVPLVIEVLLVCPVQMVKMEIWVHPVHLVSLAPVVFLAELVNKVHVANLVLTAKQVTTDALAQLDHPVLKDDLDKLVSQVKRVAEVKTVRTD